MKKITYIHKHSTISTNEDVKKIDLQDGDIVIVSTDYQKAGRGQKGTIWESEKGKNLLFSIIFNAPSNIIATEQFILSQAMAISIKQALNDYEIDKISVKWPNDIYYDDYKLCGTLIETLFEGNKLKKTIIGVGLNVNQEIFTSDAPNPISLQQISKKSYSTQEILKKIISYFITNLDKIEHNNMSDIQNTYKGSLYRRGGYYNYTDNNGQFRARIEGIMPDGRIILKDLSAQLRIYWFKELKYVINQDLRIN